MAEISKAQSGSGLNWFRLNLSKRKVLEAFRKTIITRISDINRIEFAGHENDDIHHNRYNRQYLFPSCANNINGYYETIMSNIKFSCWVKCTESELLELLEELKNKQIAADASRKSNSGTIRIIDENEVNALKWIINQTPGNLFRANVIPDDVKPATLCVPGDVVLNGEVSKMRGKVETDKFFFSVLDTKLFMIVSKGDANEVDDLAIDNAKKIHEKGNEDNEKRWMVLRASHGSEQYIDDKLSRWRKDHEDNSDVYFQTYLPIYLKETKLKNNTTVQRKSLFCPGYIFIHTTLQSIRFIDRTWEGAPISSLLVRVSMRKKRDKSENENRVLTITDKQMNDFKFIVNNNLTVVALEEGDFIENEYVKYVDSKSPLNNMVGKILHKKDKLYISFLPIGNMKFVDVHEIDTAHIRKLSNKEKHELKIV